MADALLQALYESIIGCEGGGIAHQGQSLISTIALFSPRKRGSMFLPALVCLSVCLSVTTITKKIVDGFVPNFMGMFLGGREDQVRVSLRSVEGCGSNGQKNCKM